MPSTTAESDTKPRDCKRPFAMDRQLLALDVNDTDMPITATYVVENNLLCHSSSWR